MKAATLVALTVVLASVVAPTDTFYRHTDTEGNAGYSTPWRGHSRWRVGSDSIIADEAPPFKATGFKPSWRRIN